MAKNNPILLISVTVFSDVVCIAHSAYFPSGDWWSETRYTEADRYAWAGLMAMMNPDVFAGDFDVRICVIDRSAGGRRCESHCSGHSLTAA